MDSDVINEQKERFRSAYEAGRQAYNETTAGAAEPAKNHLAAEVVKQNTLE